MDDADDEGGPCPFCNHREFARRARRRFWSRCLQILILLALAALVIAALAGCAQDAPEMARTIAPAAGWEKEGAQIHYRPQMRAPLPTPRTCSADGRAIEQEAP